jgi:hypothetical protein
MQRALGNQASQRRQRRIRFDAVKVSDARDWLAALSDRDAVLSTLRAANSSSFPAPLLDACSAWTCGLAGSVLALRPSEGADSGGKRWDQLVRIATAADVRSGLFSSRVCVV